MTQMKSFLIIMIKVKILKILNHKNQIKLV